MRQELPRPLLQRLLDAGVTITRSQRLPGDVSPRHYYRARLEDQTRVVVASYPPVEGADPCACWLATTALLEAAGVSIPRVVASDCRGRWMVLEDVGERTLYELGHGWTAPVSGHLRAALEVIGKIERLDPVRVSAVNPTLDRPRLDKELRQTVELVLEPRSLLGDGARGDHLRGALAELTDNLVSLPARPCHRDYMARNLVPVGTDAVVVLDHQDLRLGPPFYDLASLLNDSFFAEPSLEATALAEMGLVRDDRLHYHRAAAQRCLKIAGTFEAFRRRGEDRHVGLIDPALTAAVRHLAAVPETAAAIAALSDRWPR